MPPLQQPGFGLRHSPDARDARFPVRLMLDPLLDQFFPRGLPEGMRHYSVGPVLNQGMTGTCVGHGWTARANDAPIKQPLPMSPFDLYRRIVQIDEWPDNDHEANAPDDQLQSGTSIRAGARVMQALGYIQSYLWARSPDDLRAWHLANFGGFVIGVPWTSLMMETDSDGFVNYRGTVEGGHCVASKGWNDRVKKGGRLVRAMRVKNSWGREWGEGGYGWIGEDDLGRFFGDHSEFCAPVEVKVEPLAIEI